MELQSARFIVRILAAVSTVGALTNSMLHAEYGNFTIAEEPCGPRISAMGSAGTALAGGSFNCYNPTSPAFAPSPFLAIEYGKQPGELSKSGLETAWMFKRWFVGASLRVHSTDFLFTDHRSDLDVTGPFQTGSNQALQATITGGFIIGRFASGHTLNYFREDIGGDYSQHALTYCPGVMYLLVPGKITLGASLLHYLRLDTADGPWYKAPKQWYDNVRGILPRYARAGISWNDTLRRAAMPFTVATDFVYSDIYERLMVPIGAEAWILPYLAARAGVRINHPTDIAHFGFGLRLHSVGFDLDYGISRLVQSSPTEAKWLLWFTYWLPAMKKGEEQPASALRPKNENTQPEKSVIVPPSSIEPAQTVPQQEAPTTDSVNQSVASDTAGESKAMPAGPDSVAAMPKGSESSATGSLPNPVSAAGAVVPAAPTPKAKDSLPVTPAGPRDTVKK
jgi:hypothetical protein